MSSVRQFVASKTEPIDLFYEGHKTFTYYTLKINTFVHTYHNINKYTHKLTWIIAIFLQIHKAYYFIALAKSKQPIFTPLYVVYMIFHFVVVYVDH